MHKNNFIMLQVNGTKKHIDAIHKHGVTQFHRKSFEPIKSLLKK